MASAPALLPRHVPTPQMVEYDARYQGNNNSGNKDRSRAISTGLDRRLYDA